ncbi:MAG: NAD(P)-binding protein [Planctomycetota bacterium]
MFDLVDSSAKVAVIGAGLSGLTLADRLQSAGVSVSVFDKGRRVAGRMSTRLTRDGLAFDHGAQYFTVRDERFQKRVRDWQQAGIAALWEGKIGVLRNGTYTAKSEQSPRYVGVPGMNALCSSLAGELRILSEVTVASVSRIGGQWRLEDSSGNDLGLFDVVVVAIPAPQAAKLLESAPALKRQADATEMSGCWAAMVAFSESLDLGFAGAFVEDSPLSWIARDNSKPGRRTKPESWVLHASPEWSERNIEGPADSILPKLLDAFWKATGAQRRETTYQSAHRWRFALPSDPLEQTFLLDAEQCIAACGDWCGGPRIEGAFLSGLDLAERLLAD